MAELAVSGRSQYTDTMTAITPTAPMTTEAPKINMVSNPQFVFPMRPQPAQANALPLPSAHRRQMSYHTGSSNARPRTAESRHMRGVSALPSFSFSATDTSGLHAEQDDQSGQNDTLLATPRGGHRRNVSELVGGVGVGGAISSSPTKTSAIPITPRGHRHRRSTAISGHDLSFLMSPAEPQPRLSSSLPSTPLEHPGHVPRTPTATTDETVPIALQDSPTRPPSRPRVEFSDNVEYIPRPLSTISSETGSSLSTMRGHSVNNSISSVLSLGTPSPPSSRTHTRMASLGTTPEDVKLYSHRSSLEYRRRSEKEGQWLKGESPDGHPRRSLSQSEIEPPKLAFAIEDSPVKSPAAHRKRQSIGHALGFDRRRSEPAMGMHAGESSRLSALSLQGPSHEERSDQEDGDLDARSRSNTRRIKDWAFSKISRIAHKPQGESPASKASSSAGSPMMADTAPVDDQPVAETDLDAVFSQGTEISQPVFTQVFPLSGLGIPTLSQRRSFPSPDMDDYGSMLDLDAALGPFNTPSLGAQKQRRGLHSSRGARDFAVQGGSYAPSHGRTYSAPVLTAFDQGRSSSPPQAAMADVFEEEEEDDVISQKADRQLATEPTQDEDSALGVHLVDSADAGIGSQGTSFSIDDGLRLGAAWEPEHQDTYATLNSRLITPIMERRPQSIIEDTILEETSPVEPAIVEFHEEPRAPSLTKSSDSSEAPTIMAASTGMLGLPEGQLSSTTPETYQSSEFSSPDMGRRQSSFDTSRLGTSASSIADNRTMSSYTTGEHSHDIRGSVDDVPSLTSSRSTMLSTLHANSSRRDVSGTRTPSVISGTMDHTAASAHRRKRNSIQSLSQLMGGPFGSSRATGLDELRPKTAIDMAAKKPKEHRLKKLMFWKSKHREASTSTTAS